MIRRKFEKLDKLPKKLENWYQLTYDQLLKELNKKKIVLDYNEEGRLEDYFLNEQEEALKLKAEIDKTDREIDAMVYELYGLTLEEIEIVENS